MNQQLVGNIVVSPDVNKTQRTQTANLSPPLTMNHHSVGHSSRNINFGRMRQPPAYMLPTPETSQHRDGKQPMKPESDNVLRQSACGNLTAALAFENEHRTFPSGQTPFDANTKVSAMPTSDNPSYHQLPASPLSPVHVNRGPRDDFALGSFNQMDSTHVAGVNSAYPTAAEPNAGLSEFLRIYFQMNDSS